MPRPVALHRTSRIAVAAPAGPPLDPEQLAAGIEALRQQGFEVELPERSLAPHGFLAGSDAERLVELNDLLRRNDLDAIVCARGGYGSLRLLPEIDYAAARRAPKLLIGYSDITALHLALYAKAGLPGLSGPMVAPDWSRMDDATARSFWALLEGEPPVMISNPGGEPLVGVCDGTAEGVLLGGNLTLVAALLGTPYLPDLTGAILFIEEVGEAPYRIDGLLARLQLAGVLDRLGGLVLGAFTGAEGLPNRPTFTADEVLDHWTRSLPFPVARELAYGHFPRKATLPVGVRARLTVEGEHAALVTLEPLTEPRSEPA